VARRLKLVAEEPPSRAWGSLGCDIAMSSPNWQDAYSAEFPYAIYEPGKVYCLSWPMKNHGIVPASCQNPHSESDEGLDESLTLRVSQVDPSSDPTQAEFNLRNINELAGLASNCSHTWTEQGETRNSELTDQCQLGLEKHRTGHPDCKGFTRAPKICESSGAAMGTGCFKVPADMAEGHYVAQWYWDASFARGSGLQNFAYTSCFDFQVVSLGSSAARPGTTGTVGAPESELPCQNNVLKFSVTDSPAKPTPIVEPAPAMPPLTTPVPAPNPSPEQVGTAAPTPAGACAGAYEICANPTWDAPICCDAGYQCEYANEHWASCLPSAVVRAPFPPSPAATAPAPPTTACAAAYHTCADPSWESPICCQEGYQCEYANEHWASCRPFSTGSLASVSTHHRNMVYSQEAREQQQQRRRASPRGFLSAGPALVQLGSALAAGGSHGHGVTAEVGGEEATHDSDDEL